MLRPYESRLLCETQAAPVRSLRTKYAPGSTLEMETFGEMFHWLLMSCGVATLRSKSMVSRYVR